MRNHPAIKGVEQSDYLSEVIKLFGARVGCWKLSMAETRVLIIEAINKLEHDGVFQSCACAKKFQDWF